MVVVGLAASDRLRLIPANIGWLGGLKSMGGMGASSASARDRPTLETRWVRREGLVANLAASSYSFSLQNRSRSRNRRKAEARDVSDFFLSSSSSSDAFAATLGVVGARFLVVGGGTSSAAAARVSAGLECRDDHAGVLAYPVLRADRAGTAWAVEVAAAALV